MNADDEWTSDELTIIQNLATFLRTDILGIKPEQDGSLDKLWGPPYMPDLDSELFSQNGRIAQFVVLSALLDAGPQDKEYIFSTINAAGFWPRSFERYLFDVIRQEYLNAGEIDVRSVQSKIPEYVPLVYGYRPNPRTLFGTYYNWAMILRIRPSWTQVRKAVELLNDQSLGNPPR